MLFCVTFDLPTKSLTCFISNNKSLIPLWSSIEHVAISNMIQPKLQTSLRSSYGLSKTSGAIQFTLPTVVLSRSWPKSYQFLPETTLHFSSWLKLNFYLMTFLVLVRLSSIRVATPKSPIEIDKSDRRKIFEGLRSRWMMDFLWM